MSKARLLVPALLVLAVSALALAACGSSESDEDKITSAIESAATGTDPAICTEDQTLAFLEQTGGEKGKAAVEECEKDAEEEENAESVEVSEIEVEGEEATATAALTGGTLDGQTLVLALVKEEGDWKLNEAVEFKNFDREALIEQFQAKLAEQKEIKGEIAECIGEGLEEASEEELESLFLEGPIGIVEIAEECTGSE